MFANEGLVAPALSTPGRWLGLKSARRRHKFLPGPIPLPFLGNIPLFLRHFNNVAGYFIENQKKLGDVFTLWLPNPTVILNSSEAIYEAFVNNADGLSNRPPTQDTPGVELGLGNAGGVINSEDGIWQIHRRHLLGVFKAQGIGKAAMENVILEETKYFHEALLNHQSRPTDIRQQLKQSVSNIATHIVFGNRFDYDASQLANLEVDDFFAAYFKTIPAPFLRHLPFDPIGYRAARNKVMKTISFVKEQTEKHKEAFDGKNPQDFIDSFLMEREKYMEDGSNPFGDENLIIVLLQLYIAGTDTTSSVLYWAFLHLVLLPDMQEKLFEEIQEQIGSRSPVLADKENMPYTMSVITELLRIDVVGISLQHYATRDVNVLGHIIPKGTTVLANNFASTHNACFYTEPDTFIPHRFLDSAGNFQKPKQKLFTPFGIGKRICPGETLARMELFFFLTSTVQRFKVFLGQDKVPSTELHREFVNMPKERYKVRFVERI
ncbi:cytochrome P450 2B4-like [Watersipora subatra]|uniref:cytochrome P450 2B4-like n=1 Tax=Watersipora subatra TaxID=2589382 RepID=UPI00355C1DE4